jgi:polysaccharide pyruvyl transferase WcaK-like protein
VGVGGRPVVYLIGTAGNPHYGDEVITACWLRYYAERLPDAEIWLDTPRPGQTAVLHGGTHPRLRCVDTLFHACWNAPSDDVDECLEFGRTVVAEHGRLPREALGLAAAEKADLIHILGGAYINDVWPRHATLLGAVAAIAERATATTAVTGMDLAPISDSAARSIAGVLASFDVVDVRTPATAALLSDSAPRLTVTGDDAFVDLQRQPLDRVARTRTVVEIQSDLLDVPVEDLAAQAVRLLKEWEADQEEVLLLESLPPGDVAAADLLRGHLPQLTVRPFEFLWRDGFPLAPNQRWITTRFHSHLMAAAGGAWGVALAGSPVIAAQHQSLLDLGSGWTLAPDPAASVPAGHTPLEAFGGRYGEIVAAKRAVADRVTDALAR